MRFVFLLALTFAIPAHASDIEEGRPALQLQNISERLRRGEVAAPSCSVSIQCQKLSRFPVANLRDLTALGGRGNTSFCYETDETMRRSDSCQPALARTNRYSKTFVPESAARRQQRGFVDVTRAPKPPPPTPAPALTQAQLEAQRQADARRQAQERFKIATARQRYAASLRRVRDRVQNSCCANDRRCQSAFATIQPRFCKPTPDNPCTTGAVWIASGAPKAYWDALRMRAAYHSSKSNLTGETRARIETISGITSAVDRVSNLVRSATGYTYDTSKAPIVGGTIEVSPYMGPDGEFESDVRTLEHEFSHACSSIQRQIRVLSTDDSGVFGSAVFTLFPGSEDQRCDLALNTVGYYDLYRKQIFSRYQMSPQQGQSAFACFGAVASAIKRGNANRGACENSCIGQIFEEGFAELQPQNLHGSFMVADRTCSILRDSLHANPADFAECLAQTSPVFRARMAEGFGCTK